MRPIFTFWSDIPGGVVVLREGPVVSDNRPDQAAVATSHSERAVPRVLGELPDQYGQSQCTYYRVSPSGGVQMNGLEHLICVQALGAELAADTAGLDTAERYGRIVDERVDPDRA